MTGGIVFFTAASGEKSARLTRGPGGGGALFSPYDPRREAERFAAGALCGKRPAAVVVLGAGLGYLEGAAAEAAPGAAVWPVFYAPELAPEDAARGRAAWRPGGAESLAQFFERALGELDPRAVEVIEWPAAARAFPALSRLARAELLRVLKENAYSGLTVAGSGRRWLRNALANFLFLESPLAGNPLDPSRPLVIAAAGPSLERALPLVERHRGRINLWALASSLPALRSRGLSPDLVAATDPGYYASLLLLQGRGAIPLLAMPLSAARGAWRAAERVFLFAQPNFFELALFARSRVTVPAVDAHGTVAGSALLLARACGATEVFFCGLDCCYDDLRSHAAPHLYEDLAAGAATLLAPAHSRAFRRALELAPRRLSPGRFRTSEALSIYADSFQAPCARAGLRVFRLFPSPVAVPGTAEAGEAEWERAVGTRRGGKAPARLSPARAYPGREARERIVRALLDEWLGGIAAGRPAPDLVRFFGSSGCRPAGAADGEVGRLAATAEFLEALRDRFAGEGVHA